MNHRNRPLTGPPNVSRGVQIVRIFVGQEKKEYAIHKNLLCAASKFFSTILKDDKDDLSEVDLPNHHPDVFQFFSDWLYSLVLTNDCLAVRHAQASWYIDQFCLKVYSLAENLKCPGLQKWAIDEIWHLFSSNPPHIPSRDFVRVLFEEEYPVAIRSYIVAHVAYWIPKSNDASQWGQTFTAHHGYGTEIALALVQNLSEDAIDVHPKDDLKFSENNVLDLLGLADQVRQADETPTMTTKILILENAVILPAHSEPVLSNPKRSGQENPGSANLKKVFVDTGSDSRNVMKSPTSVSTPAAVSTHPFFTFGYPGAKPAKPQGFFGPITPQTPKSETPFKGFTFDQGRL